MRLGIVADDITGGTDVGAGLRSVGYRVIQTIGAFTGPMPAADAVIVSLKIRTAPVEEAVQAAEAAARSLTRAGAPAIFFKYCSTFDSTDAGNIGPITERLLQVLDAPFTVACPAYPEQARTVYQGHLFVGDRLLSESPMRHHPLTPMTDSDLRRVLARQSTRPIGLVPLDVVEQGSRAIRDALSAGAGDGVKTAIVDALTNAHLRYIADAVADLPLVTGAAGLCRALGSVLAGQGDGATPAVAVERSSSPAIVLSGSCSSATRAQVGWFAAHVPARGVDPFALAGDPDALRSLIDWARAQLRRGDAMLFSTADPEAVRAAQARYGQAGAAELVEGAFRRIASALAESGTRTFVVAGGETSGAVLDALGIRALAFGDTIETGVPWTHSVEPAGFNLALKSGNFGGVEFFARALGVLRDGS